MKKLDAKFEKKKFKNEGSLPSTLSKQFLNVRNNLIPHVQEVEWPIPAALV